MLRKSELLVIFPSYNDLPTIQRTLPSVAEDCRAAGAQLLVHDCSTDNTEETWSWLRQGEQNGDWFLILTSRMSMGDARNMCLEVGASLFVPDYVCFLEDDHGWRPGMAQALTAAMRENYGKRSPNGLLYGLFTGCRECWSHHEHLPDGRGNSYPSPDLPPFALGGANSCFRAAPTSHWRSVLKGYDTDEYMISNYQTRGVNFRNYFNGFTSLAVADGTLSFAVDRRGAGYTREPEAREWHEAYARSDRRSGHAKD